MRRRRRDRGGFEIPRDVADAAAVPADLDSSAAGPYAVPDTSRRRRAGLVYFVVAAGIAAGIGAGLPTAMWWTAVAPLVTIGGYHLLAGGPLVVREGAALELANRRVPFPVGHASAQLGFVGAGARPVWSVLVFSADDPPTERGLVRVDGRSGEVVDVYVEPVPPAER